jgi:hypothetical protein
VKGKKPIITFDKSVFEEMRKMLGFSDKCVYCGEKVTAENVGGFFARGVFHKGYFCLIQFVDEWEKHGEDRRQ